MTDRVPAHRVTVHRGGVGRLLHVVMHGEEIAHLSSARTGSATLTYLPGAETITQGLSCSLPVLGVRYTGDRVTNWIGGLLPDRSEVLAGWRARFGLTRDDAYGLLWHVGEDVAGAARFVRPERLGVDDDPRGDEPLTDEAIGDRIRRLSADAAAWGPSPGAGQFSLAGAQAKFALATTPNGWVEPSGARPTTHIFKPAIPDLTDQDLNEHLTMRLASECGLRVAPTQVVAFDGARCLVVTRFDRRRTADGTWLRVHQEDSVQALGMAPRLKYEGHGGPGVRSVARLLHGNVTDGHAPADVASFVDAVAFNWLVLGTDAHARNYALLHHGRQSRLAPLYDLNSFLPFRKDRGSSLAMKVGLSEYDPDRAGANDWEELARDCNLDAAEVLDRVRALAERLRSVAGETLHAEELSVWRSPLPGLLHDRLTTHLTRCVSRL